MTKLTASCLLATGLLVFTVGRSTSVVVADDAQSNVAAAATPAASELPAIRFARKDAAKLAERAKQLADAAGQAAAQFEVATKAVADAKAAVAVIDKTLADATAAIPLAEQAKVVADKSVTDVQEALKKTEAEKANDQEAINAAKTVVETAAKAAAEKTKQLVDLGEAKKKNETDKPIATKKVTDAEAALKPLADAKAAADKAAAEAQTAVQAAQKRLDAFIATLPKADPAVIRLVQKFTHTRPLLACRFDANADYVITGAQDNLVHRWDVFTGSHAEFAGHRSWVNALAMHPSTNLLVSGANEGQLIWWNVLDATPTAQRTVAAHQGYVRAVAISPDGQLVASAGNDKLVKVWNVADGSLVQTLTGHGSHVYNVGFHPSGKFIVSGDLKGVLKQWEVGTWKHVRDLDAGILTKYDPTFKADCGGIRSLDFSPDGKLLAAAGIADVTNAFAGVGVPTVALFDFETGTRTKVLKPKDNFQGTCWGVKFHPSGEFLVGAGGGGAGSLWFWKPDDEKSFFAFKLPTVAYDVTFHPDGLRLAVPLYDKTLVVYDLGPKVEVAAAPPAAK
ncbi:MAG: WD40 repeat domain-containing protein [Planctomycetales bacterium]|nr:WD40 repeat domain-containing protein [Planctomycetales bacterium]